MTDDVEIDDVVPPTEITPGPWRAVEHYGTANTHHTYWNIESATSYFGTDGHGFCLTGFISPANARVLGASLALYEALKSLVPSDFDDHPQDFAPEWHAARAAIAMAEGHEPDDAEREEYPDHGPTDPHETSGPGRAR